jgi:hypothetical protein
VFALTAVCRQTDTKIRSLPFILNEFSGFSRNLALTLTVKGGNLSNLQLTFIQQVRLTTSFNDFRDAAL